MLVGQGGVYVANNVVTRLPDSRCFQAREDRMIEYSGGTGATLGDAVVITGAKDTTAGIRAEMRYINKVLRTEGKKWRKKGQALMSMGQRRYDMITVLVDGEVERVFYFEITDFFRRF